MKCPPIPPDEPERLQALAAYKLDSGHCLPSLAPVVRIARSMLNMDAAAVNIVGSDYVFSASAVGFDKLTRSRDVSFCAHAILDETVMVVTDARLDERFNSNPLVTGGKLRFYAGVPLRSPNGYAIGALCVVDSVPHPEFCMADCARLQDLAAMVMDRLELHRIEVAMEQPSLADTPHEAAEQPLNGRDPLTGLLDRHGFYQHVEAVLEHLSPAALALFDLDNFKDINNMLGQETGDAVLREAASRLRRHAPNDAKVGRLGGDEFAVLLPGLTSPDDANHMAQHLLGMIAAPMPVATQELHVTACCGVALAPIHAGAALDLIGNADLALSKARQIGLTKPFVYEARLRQEVASRRLHGMELYRAFDQGEFVLYYQPQIRLADNTLTGAEALLRWQHPRYGLLSPGAFLPALENGPLAGTVGAWVVEEAIAQAAHWRRQKGSNLRVAINLFAAQLHDAAFSSDIANCLSRYCLPPEALELEITETVALSQSEHLLPTLQRLRDLGVSISFDDFGTGYASLGQLRNFPVTCVKIDRSFVCGMLSSRKDASLIHALLNISREFELRTIAEGIETQDQHEELFRNGCEEGQGYLFGRPMPAAVFTERMLHAMAA